MMKFIIKSLEGHNINTLMDALFGSRALPASAEARIPIADGGFEVASVEASGTGSFSWTIIVIEPSGRKIPVEAMYYGSWSELEQAKDASPFDPQKLIWMPR